MAPRPCNLDNMRAWIVALESGEFCQTVQVLRNPDGDRFCYCCLGVATVLAKAAGVIPWDPRVCGSSEHEHDFWCQVNVVGEETLPQGVQDWLGVDNADPVLYIEEHDADIRGTNLTASICNDDEAESFAKIAWRLRRIYLSPEEWTELPEERWLWARSWC